MQVQAEKVLSTWRREGLFAPETLSGYEVLSSTRKTSILLLHDQISESALKSFGGTLRV